MTYEITISLKQSKKFHKTQTTLLHHEWSDFYHTPNYPSDVDQPSSKNTNYFNNKQYENLTNKRPISLSRDSYVVNCYFCSITCSDNGAAIYLSKGDVHFLIEFSTFVECSTTKRINYGGGLCVYSADFAMNHICADECKSSYRSSFADIDISGRKVNSIHYSSIAYCFAQNWYTMFHSYGYIDIQSVNFSHNTACERSALYCAPSLTKDNDDDIGTRISYSSFADNNATSQYCIYLSYITSSSASTHSMNNSNIIRNSGDRTIYSHGNTNVYECVYILNYSFLHQKFVAVVLNILYELNEFLWCFQIFVRGKTTRGRKVTRWKIK